jgi:hypothetical protein
MYKPWIVLPSDAVVTQQVAVWVQMAVSSKYQERVDIRSYSCYPAGDGRGKRDSLPNTRIVVYREANWCCLDMRHSCVLSRAHLNASFFRCQQH